MFAPKAIYNLWRDVDSYDWLNKGYSLFITAPLFIAAVVVIGDGHGLRIEARHRNQPNKSKLSLYKLLM